MKKLSRGTILLDVWFGLVPAVLISAAMLMLLTSLVVFFYEDKYGVKLVLCYVQVTPQGEEVPNSLSCINKEK